MKRLAISCEWWLFCVGGFEFRVSCRCNAICTIDLMGSDDWCAHRRGSSSIRSVVSGCIAAAAAVKDGARHGRVVDFRSLWGERSIPVQSTHGDLCKQKESHDKKIWSPFWGNFLCLKNICYAFFLCLSFLLIRVTIFKSKRETKILT
jgi:hypothetical protein